MKRGVVAQLIYMLVLIAIAVVVGLFFMNIVEKNKKAASGNTLAKVSFDAERVDYAKIVVSADRNPANYFQNINFECYNNTNAAIIQKTNIENEFYAQGPGYKYEVSDATNVPNCVRVKMTGTDKTTGESITLLNKYLE